MVVTIDPLQGLNSHAEKASGLPLIDPALHEPCGTCMPQNVRGYPVYARSPARGGEALFHITNPTSIPVDDETKLRPTMRGSPKMWKKSRWNRNVRPSLIGPP